MINLISHLIALCGGVSTSTEIQIHPDLHLRPAEFNLGLLGSHFWDILVLIIVVVILNVRIAIRISQKIHPKNSVVGITKKQN